MWSSVVVILGLICVKVSELFPAYRSLRSADAVAAIVVAVIVIYVSIRLGIRTVHALLDAAPAGMEQRIAAARAVSGIYDCHNVRVRHSGPRLFVDVHVLVDGGQTLQQAHDLTDQVEAAIQQATARDADVTVHAEPFSEARRNGSAGI